MFVDIQAHWHVLLNPIPNKHTHAHTHACTHTHTQLLTFYCLERLLMKSFPINILDYRMDIIKKSTNNKCWRGCGEKGNSPTLLMEM